MTALSPRQALRLELLKLVRLEGDYPELVVELEEFVLAAGEGEDEATGTEGFVEVTTLRQDEGEREFLHPDGRRMILHEGSERR